MLFSLIKSIFTNPNGVFAIQGFFLGDKVHVSLVNETRGQTNVFEVLDSYYDQSMKMNEAMKSVGYTPQFFNRLSVEGQSAVRTLWPGDSDEKIEEKLVQLHANTLRTYLEDKKKDFEPLTNPGVLAIGTFIRDFVETGRWPWITRPLREFFVGLPWKGAKKFYLLAKSREGSVPSEKEFMFCSEFSAMVIRDVQERMEDTLRKEMLLKNAKPARPLFRPIIPPHMTLESIHPTKLERLLKENGYYKRREPSLCLRLLLEKP